MRRLANAYRLLVALQTLGWAGAAGWRVAHRAPPSPLSPALLAAVAALVLIALPLFATRTLPRIALGWLFLQVAGWSLLVSYATGGARASFYAGIAVLAAMHAFTPNRYGV